MAASFVVWLYFIELALMIFTHRLVGVFFSRFPIPRLVGDVVAGLLLGPTIWGETITDTIFPEANRPIIKMFGRFGLVMTTLVAGFSFDRPVVMKGRSLKIFGFTFLNLCVPGALGLIVYMLLPDSDTWHGTHFVEPSYVVYVVATMGSSALTAVFLIVDGLHVNQETIKFSMAWSSMSTVGLYIIMSVASLYASTDLSLTIRILRISFVGCVFFLLFGVQSLLQCLRRWSQARNVHLKNDDTAILILCCMLICSGISDSMGYTFLLGGFLVGAAVGSFEIHLRSTFSDKVRFMLRWVFLPQFFVDIGLRFNLRALHAVDIVYIGFVVLMAFVGKMLLIPLLRYFFKMSWKHAAFTAVLANCRGFNALIIASNAYSLNQIGSSFFVANVLLSLISTAITQPLAQYLRPTEQDEDLDNLDLQMASMFGNNKGVDSAEYKGGDEAEDGKRSPMTEAEMMAAACVSSPDALSEETRAYMKLIAQYQQQKQREATKAAARQELLWIEDNSEHEHHHDESLVLILPSDLQKMRDPIQGIRCFQRDAVSSCFYGREAVSWFIHEYHFNKRTIAVQLCQKLLDAGFFKPLSQASAAASPLPSPTAGTFSRRGSLPGSPTSLASPGVAFIDGNEVYHF